MKKSILSALFIVFGLVAMNAQTEAMPPTFEMKKEASAAAPTSGPIMTFEAMEVDYGVIV